MCFEFMILPSRIPYQNLIYRYLTQNIAMFNGNDNELHRLCSHLFYMCGSIFCG
uniref:Uncharacterized protein n=1 Tax=Meloidogyne enterolobii TaxID=390850 RepID=A0A6V7VM59_MELEN|nr:unnamed protein product [Meloidogyne enterolobii]